jgi:hypothetical protein
VPVKTNRTIAKRPRVAPPVLEMLTHDQGMKDCFVATTAAVHTVKMPDGQHFAALVLNQAECPIGAVVLLDRAELDAQIALLRNAIDDADRMDVGLAPLHAALSLARN